MSMQESGLPTSAMIARTVRLICGEVVDNLRLCNVAFSYTY